MTNSPYRPPTWASIVGEDPRASAALDAELDLKADADDLMSLSNGLDELNSTKAALTVTDALQVQVDALYPKKLLRFRNKVAKIKAGISNTKATILIHGDSVAFSLIPDGVIAQLYASIGFRGVWIQPSDSGSAFLGYSLTGPGGTPTGATELTSQWDQSFNGNTLQMDASGEAVVFSVPSALAITSAPSTTINRATVVYVRRSGGGQFKIQTLRERGTTAVNDYWVDVATINTSHTETLLATYEVTLAATEAGSVRVVWVSGDSRVVGVLLENTGASGLVVAPCNKGGIDMVTSTGMSAASLSVFLGLLQPDLIYHAFKDDGSPTLADKLTTYKTKMDIAYASDYLICCPYTDATTNTAEEVTALAEDVIAFAKANGCDYFDTRFLVPDYATATSLGVMADVTHFNATGTALLGPLLWRSTGLVDFDSVSNVTNTERLDSISVRDNVTVGGVSLTENDERSFSLAMQRQPCMRIPASITAGSYNRVARGAALDATSFTILGFVKVPTTTAADLVLFSTRDSLGGGNAAKAFSFTARSSDLRINLRNEANNATLSYSSGNSTIFWGKAGKVIPVAIRRNAAAATGETIYTALIGSTLTAMQGSGLTGLEAVAGLYVFQGAGVVSVTHNQVSDHYGFGLMASALTDAQLLAFARTYEIPTGMEFFYDYRIGSGESAGLAFINASALSEFYSPSSGTLGRAFEVTGNTELISGSSVIVNSPSTRRVMTLPPLPGLGAQVRVCGKGAAGWRVGQPALHQIVEGAGTTVGTNATTIGTGGHLSSGATNDSVTLQCITATAGTSYVWQVVGKNGTLTWV